MNRTVRGARLRKAFWALGLGSAFFALAPSASAQTQRVCNIGGSVSVVTSSGTTSEPSLTAVYTESGNFVTAAGNPSTTNLQLNLPTALTESPPWLLSPFFQTMGVNEGPNTCSQVGDGGQIVYTANPQKNCGSLTDTFSVTSTSPYTLSHTLSGTVDISGLPALDARTQIIRNVQTEFTSTGASGDVFFTDPFGVQICAWTYSVQYTAGCHAASGVTIPATYQATALWNAQVLTCSGGSANGAACVAGSLPNDACGNPNQRMRVRRQCPGELLTHRRPDVPGRRNPGRLQQCRPGLEPPHRREQFCK